MVRLTDLTGPKHSQSRLYQLGYAYYLTIMENYNRWTFVHVLRGTKLTVIPTFGGQKWGVNGSVGMDVFFWIGLWQQNYCIVEVVTRYNHCMSNIASLCIILLGVTSLVMRFGCYFASFSSEVTQLMDMPSRPGQRYVVAAPRIPWSTFVVQVLLFRLWSISLVCSCPRGVIQVEFCFCIWHIWLGTSMYQYATIVTDHFTANRFRGPCHGQPRAACSHETGRHEDPIVAIVPSAT